MLLSDIFSSSLLSVSHNLRNGCGQAHDPTEKTSIKLSLKFPVLAPSRSRNTDQVRYP